MSEREFRRLKENIERDGCLTSVPLVYRVDGALRILSGNHRVQAARAAGLEETVVMEITGDLTEARQVAIQLSHNAIVGEDDPNVLRELYASLEMLEQLYSGLTDDDLGLLEAPDLSKLNVGPPRYEEVLLSFLPEDKAVFEENIDRIRKFAERKTVHVARHEDFNMIFDALLRVKDQTDLFNDAVAFQMMSELALARLDQLEELDALDPANAHAREDEVSETPSNEEQHGQ